MKRSLLLLAACLMAWLPTHADRFTDAAEKHLNWTISSRADSVLAHATPQVKQAIAPQQLNGIWNALTQQFGALAEKEAWETTALGEGMTLCRRTLHFRNGSLYANLVFDAELKLAGISFTPAIVEKKRGDVEARPLPVGVKEESLNVEHGDIELPGTLTLPETASTTKQVPVVVLLSGSGPSDGNGTMGPNEPLRDLAHDLALKGIASLRYDKRTKAHMANFLEVSGGRTTLETEYVEDALVALRTVAARPEIDSKRVYVAGHSLGGTVAPLVAKAAGKQVAGIIVLAGAARPFWDLALTQLRYIYSLQEPNAARVDSLAQAQLAAMKKQLPADYIASMDQYKPLATAKKLRKLPMLFLQGGTDYQVTREDLALWKQACRRNKRARFTFFPELDHLFRPQAKKAVPQDYLKKGEMSEKVAEEIAGFVAN